MHKTEEIAQAQGLPKQMPNPEAIKKLAATTRGKLRGLQMALNVAIDNYLAANIEGQVGDEANMMQQKCAGIADAISGLMTLPAARLNAMGFAPTTHMAIRIGMDLDLFNLVPFEGIHLDQLYPKTPADRELVMRVLRVLGTTGVFNEIDANVYGATPFSKALSNPDCAAWMRFTFDNNHPLYLNIPKYLKKTNYAPMTATKNATTDLTGMTAAEWLNRSPEALADFNSSMQFQDRARPEWKPAYPFGNDLVAAQQNSAVVGDNAPSEPWLVDVGGGRGYFLKETFAKFPELFTTSRLGRIVLQDVKHVVDDVDHSILPPNVEVMAHDCFKPQPVPDAKYYFYRKVFHGFPDNVSLIGLKHVAEVMKKGHSKLLIWEFVLPNKGPSLHEVGLDMNMLTCNGVERNEDQWRNILGQTGLEITNIHRAKEGGLAIIEAMLV